MEDFSKFDTLFENFSTGVVLHDSSTQILFANHSALKILGLSMDQLRGKTVTDPHWRFLGEDGSILPVEEFPVAQVKATHKPVRNLVGAVIRSDLAPPVWVICNAHPEFDVDGNLKYIIVNFTDITDQKLAEEKLSEQLDFTKSLINSMLDGFSVIDKNGIQSDVNYAFCQMTGFSRDELIGSKPPFPYWPPEEYDNIQRSFTKTLVQEFGNFEMMFMRKNGERFPVIVAPSNIKDKNNNIICYMASVKEITERKQAEKELKELADQLRETNALAHIGIWKWVIAPDIVVWSDELFRIAGLDPKLPPPSYTQLAKLHTPESWVRLQAAVSNALATGEPYQLEVEYNLPDGSHRNVNAFGGAKRDTSGKIIELFGTVQDITEKKQAEIQLKSALKAAENAVSFKSRFLDIAAHELRTPVTAFSLLLQLAQRKFKNGIQVELSTLDRLRSQVDRISQLVIELLDVSRLERGVLSLKLTRTNLVSMISNCIEDFKLRETNRRFNFSSASDSIEIDIDSLRIFQVISNLIDNAIKYTPNNTPIEISVELKPGVVRVSIQDHGAGITEEHQKDLFSPFSRGSSEFAEEAGGLGLGLFISQEIIVLHGGTMGVESKVGTGSTFYFELPFKK